MALGLAGVLGLPALDGGAAAAPAPPAAPAQTEEVAAGALHGLMTTPAGSTAQPPIVLIVPGSGPTNRDGDSPAGVSAAPYRRLAEALAELGVATIRVDKRGMFSSAYAGDANAVSVEAYASDYRAWIDALRAKTGASCIWLLGHSEGALMVSAAAQGRKDVCGLVLVSGVGRSFGAVLREQLNANPANAPILSQALAAIDDLEAGRSVDTSAMHPALRGLFAKPVQPFLMSLMKADPAALAKSANVPTLIVQGDRDIQVSVEDAKALAAASGGKLAIIPGMNHVLKLAPADRAGNVATYRDAALPLAPGVAQEIASFLTARR